MVKERYVSLEVAKLLKDKGFNEDYPKGECTMYGCTQQMACDWIEETFNISIMIYVNIIGYNICICYTLKNPNIAANVIEDDIPDEDNSDGSWGSKELAYNKALKYVLTNLV